MRNKFTLAALMLAAALAGIQAQEARGKDRNGLGKTLAKTGIFPHQGHIPDNTQPPSKADVQDPRKAKITLDVQIDWGDGSGYQILLDSNHNTYGNAIPEDRVLPVNADGSLPASFYEIFEYTLPENADGSLENGNWVSPHERRSIEIPPGTYDYCVTNPSPGQYVYIASGEDAVGDDISFEAGVEYIFQLRQNGNYDLCTREAVAPVELALSGIILPESGWNLGQEPIRIELVNRGTEPVSSFKIQLCIDGNINREESAELLIPAGDTIEHTLQNQADFSEPGRHTLSVKISAEQDADQRNDYLEKTVYHIAAQPCPYECDFNHIEDFDRWNILDSNSDGTTWQWMQGRDATGNPDGGYVLANFSPRGISSDDYIVSKDPVMLPAGKNHIAFWYTAYSPSYNESIAVYWGESDKPGEMEMLWADSSFNTDQDHWRFQAVEFETEQDGEYHFAFHCFSKPEQWAVLLDEISIDTGSYTGQPDIRADQVLLPLSSCSLAQESIGARLSNQGTADISRFKLSCRIGDSLAAEQIFQDSIKTGGSLDVYFNQKGDFSTADSLYTVTIRAEVLPDTGQKPEENRNNNQAEGTIRHFSPKGLPFQTRFSEASQREAWACEENAWVYDPSTEALANQSAKPLVSQCVRLEEGAKYRISVLFKAGTLMWDVFQATEDFSIDYGPSGSELSEWDSIFLFKEIYTGEEFAEYSKEFIAQGSGEHAFAIRPITTNYTIRIKEIHISRVQDYDIRLEYFDAGLPRLVPAKQANTKFMTSAQIRNQGLYPVDSILLRIYNKDKMLIEGRAALGEPDSCARVSLPVILDNLQPGDSLVLTARASISGHEGQDFTNDNAMDFSALITDSIMAHDQATPDAYFSGFGIGAKTPLNLGLAYRINTQDTLTAFSIGWAEGEDQKVGIALYRWDAGANRLGELLFLDSVDRGSEAGQQEYPVPALALSPGTYMFEARQLTRINFAMVSDFSEDGYFYVTSNTPVSIQNDLGFPAFRAIFGTPARTPGANNAPLPRKTGIVLYPNPATEQVCIRSENGKITRIVLFDAQGKRISQWTGKQQSVFLDIASCKPGLHIVEVRTENSTDYEKLIVP